MSSNTPEVSQVSLDEMQSAVVRNVGGNLRVVGGPGTGKTFALVEAVVDRAQAGDKVLVLCANRQSVDSTKIAVAKRIHTGTMPLVTTFHSFALAVFRRFAAGEFTTHWHRLLNASEQDPRVRTLLNHAVREGRIQLPKDYDLALGTQGLAEEVRRLLAKAQQLDLSPTDVEALGREQGIEEWEALGPFFAEYLDVIGAEGGIDYFTLIPIACQLVRENHSSNELAFDAVFADDYHETDTAQQRLLDELDTPSTDVTVVGDPSQMIFRFRGSNLRGLMGFGAVNSSTEVPTIVLTEQHRSKPPIAQCAAEVVKNLSLTGLSASDQQAFRQTGESAGGASAEGAAIEKGELVEKGKLVEKGEALEQEPVVELKSFLTQSAEYSSVADSIRRAKLSGKVDSWSDVAVIARSSTQGLSVLHQTLVSAGVPGVIVGQDAPLRDEPGVVDLLTVLRASGGSGSKDDNADKGNRDERLPVSRARQLAVSPLGGLSPSDLRHVSRELRDRGVAAGREPKNAAEALRDAMLDPSHWDGLKGDRAAKGRKLAALIDDARQYVSKGQDAYTVLWAIWSGSKWSLDLEAQSRNFRTARAANRTLDAVVSLFDFVGRIERVQGSSVDVGQVLSELDNQSFAVDPQSNRQQSDAVQLVSAHRAVGREWPMVIIVDLQEGSWPKLTQRVSLLKADQLGPEGHEEPMSVIDQIRDERRLLNLAISRAESHLVITCVSDATPSTSGVVPSRFFDQLVELAQENIAAGGSDFDVSLVQGMSPRGLTTSAMVAQLRQVLEDGASSDELKEAAANRLALLKDAGVRAADPNSWWGLHTWSVSDAPVRDPEKPLRISGSAWKDIEECSLRWFLSREAGGSTARGSATAFGSVVHALADAVGRGEIEPDLTVLKDQIESVWYRLGHESTWQAHMEQEAAVRSLERFLEWQEGEGAERTLISTEQSFDAVVPLRERNTQHDEVYDQVQIVGSADRLELDQEGRAVVVDLKNQSVHPSAAEVAKHRQLWLYQLAVAVGAFQGEPGDLIPTAVGGAELVQLRNPNINAGAKVQRQAPVPIEELKESLTDVVDLLRQEQYVATPGSHCRYCDFAVICPAKQEGEEVVS